MRALVLLVLCAAASGCAHQTTFTSTPSGADVIIDGETVGQTPLVWSQPLSNGTERQVVVQREDARVAFTMRETGFDTGTIASFFAGCVGTPCSMWLVGGLGAGLAFTIGGPAVVAGFVLLPVAIIGTLCWVPGLITAAILVPLLARAGPDTVIVDLQNTTAVAEPPDRVVNVVGAMTVPAAMRY